MQNWTRLRNNEYNDILSRFEKEFNFNPSIYGEDRITYNVKKPFITYDISSIWESNCFEEFYRYYMDLHQKILEAFIECTLEDETVYALDWNHQCYFFDPRNKIETKFFEFAGGEKIEKWIIEVLPNGDYYIFLASDFRFGILGHPWKKTICIFGEDLIKALSNNNPILFTKIVSSEI